MKKFLGFFVFCLLLSFPAVGFSVDLGGGYSLDLEEGWTALPISGSPYKAVFGTRINDFTPNINIQEENNPLSLDKYIQGGFSQIEKVMKAVKISEGTFSAKNTDGKRLVIHTEFNQLHFRQILYFFEKPSGMKVVVTATATRASGGKLDTVFDKMMMTFQIN